MDAPRTIHQHPIHLGFIGTSDFCRRLSSAIARKQIVEQLHHAQVSDAWALVLSHRPNMLVIEVGIHHNQQTHQHLREFLTNLRERVGNEVHVTVALAASSTLAYGGDLLFADNETFEPSGFLDNYIVQSPAHVASIPSLAEQLQQTIELYRLELQRRKKGSVPLPTLGAPGWVQSLADPKSRELWMKWLPRYASYTNENPLILGETGTGKTNLAYALHLLAGLKGKFIGITPRDFSSSELVQAELFGAVEGAYTGAVDKWGLVHSAEQGTLFIDELQSIDKDLQGKLITFIENKTYRRVGSTKSIDADVRFVFATNKSLYEMMTTEVLRDDFAYRLERVILELAPLRRRPLDVTAALAYALAKVRRQRTRIRFISGTNADAYRMLFSHSWPGNLRQLENNVAKLCELTDMEQSDLIEEEAVLEIFQSKLSGAAVTPAEVISQAASRLADTALRENLIGINPGKEKLEEYIRIVALETSGGELSKAAELILDEPNILELVSESLAVQRAGLTASTKKEGSL